MKYEITRYEWQLIHGEPKIVISTVKQMDDDGNYIKFLRMAEAMSELPNHPVTFKKLEDKNHVK